MDSEFWRSRFARVFDSYELCSMKERTKTYEAAEGDLLSKEVKEEEGVSLRAIRAGKMIFSYTYEQGEKAAAALIGNAEAIAPFLQEDRFYAFPDRGLVYPSLDLYDGVGLKESDDSKIRTLIDMESIIRGSDPRITTTRNCGLHESEIAVEMVNSNGLEARATKTVYALSGMAVAAEGDEEVSWYDWVWSSRYKDLTAPDLGRRIAEKAVSFLSGEILDTGVYSGLLTPACSCQILEILASSFLSENLYKNKTLLKDKAGQKIFSELLTLIDSGTRGIGAFAFDGEGVPSRENTVVRQGVFEGFLYDTYYGNMFKKTSTGNSARSGIKDPPRCATRGFYIDAGQGKAAIETFDNGIIVEELMGTHMANAVTGDFSLGAIGHYLSGGTRKPFKGVIFSGNLFDVLSSVQAVGEDLTFYGSYGAPTLLFEGLKISGK